MAITNPFLRYGKYSNLNQTNAGAKWSIQDSTAIVDTRSHLNKLSKNTEKVQQWKHYTNFERMKPHSNYVVNLKEKFKEEVN